MIGQSLGSYKITDRIGEGGMGVVYAAEHALLGRPAAVKVLLPDFTHKQEIVQRFFNEARAATAINHPGIVEVYDFGYAEDGSAYLVMEFLRGESLQDRLARGQLPLAMSFGIARQIASALDAAHAEGIVHRDLKPDNVFLVPDPDMPAGERIKVLDFGIAKLTPRGEEGEGSVKTRTGMVMGTPAYMSPEQCRGAGHVDQRSDLYSLGCILFEMVTGRPPFVGEGAGTVMAQHIYEPPPSILEIEGSVPQPAEALFNRVLAKEPEARHQSAAELAEQLAGLLDQLGAGGRFSTQSGAEGAPPQGEKKTTLSAASGPVSAAPTESKRRPRWPILALVGLLAVGGGVAAIVAGGGSEGDQVAAAEDEPDPDAEDEAEAEEEPEGEPATEAEEPEEPAEPESGSDSAAEDEPEAAPAEIEIRLESDPSGAHVYRMPSGVRVGATPYTYRDAPMKGELVFRLERKGYKGREVSVSAEESSERTVDLEKRRRVSAGSRKTGAQDKKGSAGEKRSDGAKKKTNKDDGTTLNPFERKKKGSNRTLDPFEND